MRQRDKSGAHLMTHLLVTLFLKFAVLEKWGPFRNGGRHLDRFGDNKGALHAPGVFRIPLP